MNYNVLRNIIKYDLEKLEKAIEAYRNKDYDTTKNIINELRSKYE